VLHSVARRTGRREDQRPGVVSAGAVAGTVRCGVGGEVRAAAPARALKLRPVCAPSALKAAYVGTGRGVFERLLFPRDAEASEDKVKETLDQAILKVTALTDQEIRMNKRLFLSAAAMALTALAFAMTLGIQRTRAQPLPLDECISVGNSSPTSRLCMHTFSDHSKCVVAVTPGTEFNSTQLSCKIT